MKTITLIVLVILLQIQISGAQPHESVSYSYSRDVLYTTHANSKLYLDLYTPGGANLAQGIGIKKTDTKDSLLQQDNGTKLKPIVIWVSDKDAENFPTPIASYIGNGYMVASIQYRSNSEIFEDLRRAISFIKLNAVKYSIDTLNIGVLQAVGGGYLAAVWQDNQKIKSIDGLKTQQKIFATNDTDFSKLQSEETTDKLISFFDKNLRKGVHTECDPLLIQSPADSWIDPITNTIQGTTYQLYPTTVRGEGTFGSNLIYLPKDYNTSNRRFPVIYWLHGGNGTSRSGSWMCEQMINAMNKGDMPQSIVVFVQGLPIGWYNNSKDGTKPVEDVIIKNLIPYIDSNYRTINSKEARGIEGMSMGGYGALHLGFKYPELFGVVSAIAPSITTYEMERKEVIYGTFENDTAYFNANSPSTLVEVNVAQIKNKMKIRLLVGDKDFLLDVIRKFHQQMIDLDIEHQYAEAMDAEHEYDEVIKKLEFNSFTFWKEAFKE